MSVSQWAELANEFPELRWPGGVVVSNSEPAFAHEDEEPERKPRGKQPPAAKSSKAKARVTESSGGTRRHNVTKYSTSYSNIAAFPVPVDAYKTKYMCIGITKVDWTRSFSNMSRNYP